jgi:hypothetical protein
MCGRWQVQKSRKLMKSYCFKNFVWHLSHLHYVALVWFFTWHGKMATGNFSRGNACPDPSHSEKSSHPHSRSPPWERIFPKIPEPSGEHWPNRDLSLQHNQCHAGNFNPYPISDPNPVGNLIHTWFRGKF